MLDTSRAGRSARIVGSFEGVYVGEWAVYGIEPAVDGVEDWEVSMQVKGVE